MKPWRVREEAREDIDQAAAWYEDDRNGLGEDFVAAVERALSDLAKMPGRAAPMPGRRHRNANLRRFLLRRFPYAIVILDTDSAYEVVAIAHQRRRPGYWKKRLAKPSP